MSEKKPPTGSAQEFYNKAVECWEKKENDKAWENIDKALELCPEDLTLHSLAIHIKRRDFISGQHIAHAEFIMDHDIHFSDPHNPKQPHWYIDVLMFSYRIRNNADKLLSAEGFDEKVNLDDRLIKYGRKALEAGYPISIIDVYIDALVRSRQFDEAISAGAVLLGVKDADETALPGLGKCKVGDNRLDILSTLHKAFFQTGQFQEARDFYHTVLKHDPYEWMAHDFLGEIYCNLNQPAESARQWMHAVAKRGWHERSSFGFDDLCKLVSDPLAGKKAALFERIAEVKKTVPVENKAFAKKISTQAHAAIGDKNAVLLNEKYAESKLGVKLPVEQEKHYDYFGRLWLPATQGPHPYRKSPVKETTDGRQKPAEGVSAKTIRGDIRTIERFGVDITGLAREGKLAPIAGRESEIDSIVRILLRMEKNNPVLLGSAGVGKTAVIHGLAQRIVSDHVPPFLKNLRIFELSMSSLVAGTRFRGDFEQRMTQIIDEARDNPDIILFVDELHTIMGAGAAQRGDLDAANIVKPALARGTLRLAGATTTREYGICIEKDPAMARRFTPVRVGELDRGATIDVLRKRRELWRESRGVEIPDDVIIAAVDLTDARLKNRAFPDKAIDLLDESCALARTRRSPDKNNLWVLRLEEVNQVIGEWTGGFEITTSAAPENSTPRILSGKDIQAQLSAKVVGQKKAIGILSEIVIRIRMSLKNPNIPTILLFHGPAGSGKATCCEALSSVLWPNETDRMMILNCAEYTDFNSLDRLIGFPPGYGGQNEGGILNARLRRRPHSIIMLPNFAKAHWRVLGFFEQLFKHGSYTDSSGRLINGADAVFVIPIDTTSRPHSMGFKVHSGQDTSDQRVLDDLRRDGVPERLFSLFTAKAPFADLSTDTAREIMRMRFDTLRQEYAKKGYSVSFDEKLEHRLADSFMSLSPERRDIETLIDKEVGCKVRDAILSGVTEEIFVK